MNNFVLLENVFRKIRKIIVFSIAKNQIIEIEEF